MAKPNFGDAREFGDFQTPRSLAHDVCELLLRADIKPGAILEPTCGRGAFLEAAASVLPKGRPLYGVEINERYVCAARQLLGSAADIRCGNFFDFEWTEILSNDPGPWLVLGNPPWVTNAELGALGSTNLPTKTNFQGHKGLDAITGKANFDISEWMLLKQIDWLEHRGGWVAMLVKTSVARKILRQIWAKNHRTGRASIYKIDAMKHFGAAVDACLFVLPIGVGEISSQCDVYDDLFADNPSSTIGFHNERLVSNISSFLRWKQLIGSNFDYTWRSGVKHDCSKVMELKKIDGSLFENGLGHRVELEPDMVFPLLKSSDVAKGRQKTQRYMIVTQREVGGDTGKIAAHAPKTWQYLLDYAPVLDARGSVIYRGKPRFSVFGIGGYTFAPWKVAISGFYKSLNFLKVGPVGEKPVVMDDTVYFLPCETEEEADLVVRLLQSAPYIELLTSMIFNDEKRPITADLLKRISLQKVADVLGVANEYRGFTVKQQKMGQLDLGIRI